MVGAFAAMLLQDHFKRIQHLERLLADRTRDFAEETR
jgi:hypothetical protein